MSSHENTTPLLLSAGGGSVGESIALVSASEVSCAEIKYAPLGTARFTSALSPLFLSACAHSLYNKNLRIVVFSVHHVEKACTIRISSRIRFRDDLVRDGNSPVLGSRSAASSYRRESRTISDTNYACPTRLVQLWKKVKLRLNASNTIAGFPSRFNEYSL